MTGLVTLMTTLLNRRYEHRRWLLDRRLEAYTAFNIAANRCVLTNRHRATDEQAYQESVRDLTTETQRLRLVAPLSTGWLAIDVLGETISGGKGKERAGPAEPAARKLFDKQLVDIQGAVGGSSLLDHARCWWKRRHAAATESP